VNSIFILKKNDKGSTSGGIHCRCLEFIFSVNFTISEPARPGLLGRLMESNHARHAEEVKMGLHAKGKGKAKAKAEAKGKKQGSGQLSFLDE